MAITGAFMHPFSPFMVPLVFPGAGPVSAPARRVRPQHHPAGALRRASGSRATGLGAGAGDSIFRFDNLDVITLFLGYLGWCPLKTS